MIYLKILVLLLFCRVALAQTIHKPTEKKRKNRKKEAWKNFQKVIESRIHNDWAWLNGYADDNENYLRPRWQRRIVFLGNSITEGG